MNMRNINLPATLVHTIDGKKYRLNGRLLAINESKGTCTMKFGKEVSNNIPLNELYLTEGVLDKLKDFGYAVWNKIKKVVKLAAGFIVPISEKGEKLVQFINNPINLIAMRRYLPEGVEFYPNQT